MTRGAEHVEPPRGFLFAEHGTLTWRSKSSGGHGDRKPYPNGKSCAARRWWKSAQRRRHERDQPLTIAVAPPDDPRVRELVIRPDALGSYATLHREGTDDDAC